MKQISSMIPGIKTMATASFAIVLLLPLSARAEIKAGSFEVSPFGSSLFRVGNGMEGGLSHFGGFSAL